MWWTSEYDQTIELLKGNRQLSPVFLEMQSVINGTEADGSPFLPLMRRAFFMDKPPEPKPEFEACDFEYGKIQKPYFNAVDFFLTERQGYFGGLVRNFAVLAKTNLNKDLYYSNYQMEAKIRSLLIDMQKKYGYAADIDWSEKYVNSIDIQDFDEHMGFYLVGKSFEQIKAKVLTMDDNICDVLRYWNNGICVLLKEPARRDNWEKYGGSNRIGASKSLESPKNLREQISSESLKIIMQNDELNLWKRWFFVVFGDRETLMGRFRGNEDEFINMDCDHCGGYLY